jgi:hypothetical protein
MTVLKGTGQKKMTRIPRKVASMTNIRVFTRNHLNHLRVKRLQKVQIQERHHRIATKMRNVLEQYQSKGKQELQNRKIFTAILHLALADKLGSKTPEIQNAEEEPDQCLRNPPLLAEDVGRL